MGFQGIRTSIAKKPYIFVIIRGGGEESEPLPPSGSAHARCRLMHYKMLIVKAKLFKFIIIIQFSLKHTVDN